MERTQGKTQPPTLLGRLESIGSEHKLQDPDGSQLQEEIVLNCSLLAKTAHNLATIQERQDRFCQALSTRLGNLEVQFNDQTRSKAKLHLDQEQKLQDVVNDINSIKSALAEMKTSMEAANSQNKANLGLGHVLSDVKDPQVRSFDMDSDPEQEQPAHSACHEKSLHVQLEHTYALQQSIWDAGLFIGISSVGVHSSIYLGIAMITNAVVQATFCVVCWLAFRQPQIQDDGEFLMKMWRFNAAHDVANVDSMWPFSLATRVCNGDASLYSSAQQQNIVDAISLYREGASVVGELMCLACLVCFWNILWSDCKETLRFGSSLHLTLGQCTRISLVDDKIRIHSVGRSRSVLCWTTVFLKFAVFVSLGMTGTVWLAHTVSVVDLILNAVALELILSVDELIYAGLAPSLVKAHILKCAPLRTWSLKKKVGIDIEAMVGMFGFFVLLPVVHFWKVRQTSTLLKNVGDALCGGTQNFVYGVDALGMVHIHDAMAEPPHIPFRSIDSETDFRALALSEVMNGKSREEWQYARWAPSIEALKQKISADLDITMSLTSQCIDVLTSANCQHFDACPQYRKALRALTGDTSFEWCSDVNVELHCYGQSAVALMSKAVCPVTCGCTSVTSGIYVVGSGSDVHCPMTCHRILEVSFAEMKDVCNEDEDGTSRMWQLWMGEAATILPTYIREPLKDQGCNALAMASDHDRADLCNGELGIASTLKPLLGVCPRACGCFPNSHDDLCTWRGHRLEACSCHGSLGSVIANCQNDACKNSAVSQGQVTYLFPINRLEDVNGLCACPWLLKKVEDIYDRDLCNAIKECPVLTRIGIRPWTNCTIRHWRNSTSAVHIDGN